MILLELFLGFLEVGCFSFGGGYAAVALIREVVLSRGWLTEELLAYIIAVSESTPGPLMVNLATYVGSSQAGAAGAAVATLAVVLPAFCIILALMAVLRRFTANPWVRALMTGLKACVTGLILAAGLEMLAGNLLPGGLGGGLAGASGPDWLALALVLLLGGFWFGLRPRMKKKPSPVALILLAALLGAAAYSL
ncbi:MAG: chromate transporter [Oscillospiraceae bacterium]|nr:chromate transporter [Oscillospiraceae bacterium]